MPNIYACVEVSAGGAKAGETYSVHALVAPSVWWAEVTLAINRLATAVIMRLAFAAIASAATAWCWALSKIKTEHKNMMSRKDGCVEEHSESIYQFQQLLLEYAEISGP